MGTIISRCGLLCNECPALLARKNDDEDLRKKTAKEWSKQFGMPVAPEGINCDGCLSDGVHSSFCEMCEVRMCGVEKGLSSCAFCDEYACEKLEKILSAEPECRKRLDEMKEKGIH